VLTALDCEPWLAQQRDPFDPFSYRLLVMVVSLAAIFLSTVMLISRLFAVVRGTLAKLSVSALRFDYISVLAMSGEESLA
jgi:hypothetical protein